MASTIKVNNIQNQCGANIANKCGSTVTLGASGDTITLACGASQTGFGRTGTVDWNTTAITADPANAVSGTGYFANTTSAAFTITLPTSPSAGDIVSVRDYAQTFATNNLTIGRNGQPIDGLSNDLTLSTSGQAITLVYVDGTQGWKSVNSNETVNEIKYITATGGTVTCCGDYKIHTFTGPGTFTVSCAGNAAGSNSVDYLVIAGGGGGSKTGAPGYGAAGGGGAGGFRESSGTASGCYTASPLGACVSALPVSVTGYPITVGAGGAGGTGSGGTGGASIGSSGNNSVFSTITSTGGGRGANFDGTAANGGSGGGGTGPNNNTSGGTGNTPPVSPPQGNDGGDRISNDGGAGGGGASASGSNSTSNNGAAGGAGVITSISASPTSYAGGGGGGGYGTSGGAGGTGGGGAGGGQTGPGTTSTPGTAGTTNTGGGGGAGGGTQTQPTAGAGAAGGSGIVIIRYKYQ
jgi:hypothetical protein